MPEGKDASDRARRAAADGTNKGDPAEVQAGRAQDDDVGTQTPHCFLCGRMPVRLCFAPDGAELGSLLESYFIGLKKGAGIP